MTSGIFFRSYLVINKRETPLEDSGTKKEAKKMCAQDGQNLSMDGFTVF